MPSGSLTRGLGRGRCRLRCGRSSQRHRHVTGIHTWCLESKRIVCTNVLGLRCKGKQVHVRGETLSTMPLPLRAWWRFSTHRCPQGHKSYLQERPPCFPACAGLGAAHGHSWALTGTTRLHSHHDDRWADDSKGPREGAGAVSGQQAWVGCAGRPLEGATPPCRRGASVASSLGHAARGAPVQAPVSCSSHERQGRQALRGKLCSVPSAEPVIR